MRALNVTLLSAALILTPSAAMAGSDSPTPYTVTADGITLPAGVTFPAHGHVNWRTSWAQHGVHFDPNNGQPGGKYIGKSFLPFNLEPGECITWVQISLYDEHFGEGGQAPVCAPSLVTQAVTWNLPDGYTGPPASSDPRIWPQTLATGKECGGWWQVDTYYGTQLAIDAVLADGVLTNGEDHHLTVSWRFDAQPACVTPEPEPSSTPTPTLPPKPSPTEEPTWEPTAQPTEEPSQAPVDPAPKPSDVPTSEPSPDAQPSAPPAPSPTTPPTPQGSPAQLLPATGSTPTPVSGASSTHQDAVVASPADLPVTGLSLRLLIIAAILATVGVSAVLYSRKKA